MFLKYWTPELVCEHICSLYNKESVNSHYISVHHSGLYAAGCRFFGSWKTAVAAAGFDYSTVRKYKAWDQEQVLKKIQERFEKKEPMTCQYVQVYCRDLYMAAVHKFGSWQQAVAAAGVDYDSIRMRRRLTTEEIKEEIINLFESGENLAYTNMRKNYSYLLTYGIRRIGNGSWAEARRKCGIYKNFRKKRSVPEGYLEPELFPVDRRGL